jgi:dipeptidase E
VATQIIAIGGGGFLHGSEPGIEHYILEQSLSDRPRVGFIATASGDASSALVKFYSRFSPLACIPSHLGLFDRTPDLDRWFAEQDIIYAGGGNTRSMLAVWRDWGLPSLLLKAAESGTILAGISAGAICWFEHGTTDSMANILRAMPCLGFLSGSCCPHYSEELERRPTF